MVIGFLTAVFPTVALLGIGLLIYEMTRTRPQYLTYEQDRSGFRDVPQMPAKKASNLRQRQKNDSKNTCKLCGESIQDRENDLTKLPCDHQFHSRCISRHFKVNKNEFNEACCPALYCTERYSISIDVPQMPAKEAPTLRQRQKNDYKKKCELCDESIQDEENDLTKLSCDHLFHTRCISESFESSKDQLDEAICPAPYCRTSYSIAA